MARVEFTASNIQVLLPIPLLAITVYVLFVILLILEKSDPKVNANFSMLILEVGRMYVAFSVLILKIKFT